MAHQATDEYAGIPAAAFRALVRVFAARPLPACLPAHPSPQATDLLRDIAPDLTLRPGAVSLLHAAAEAYVTDLFHAAALPAQRRMRGRGRYTHDVDFNAMVLVRDEPSEPAYDSADASASASECECDCDSASECECDSECDSESDMDSGAVDEHDSDELWTSEDMDMSGEAEEDEEDVPDDSDHGDTMARVEYHDTVVHPFSAVRAPDEATVCALTVNEGDLRTAHAIRHPAPIRPAPPAPGDATVLRGRLGPLIAELVASAPSHTHLAPTRGAVAVLEAAAEDYLTALFRDAHALMTNGAPADRVPVLWRADIHMVRCMRGPAREGLW